VRAICLRKKEMAWLARSFEDLVAVEDAFFTDQMMQ
jgi:hypothetical protein